MAGKKINFGRRSRVPDKAIDVEEWVSHREALMEPDQLQSPAAEAQPEKTKRLTLDIPASLHRAIKLKATHEGVTMVELLRQLLEKHYGSEGES